MTRSKWVAVGSIAAVLCAAAGGYWYWTQSPQYALREIASAIQEHDRQRFERYVDVDAILNRGIDDYLELQVAKDAEANGEPSLGAQIGQGLVELMKPKLVETIKGQIDKLIEPTNGEPVNGDSPFAQVLRTAAVAEVNRDGQLTHVTIDAELEKYEVPLEIVLSMRKEDGRQRLFAIANLTEVVSTYEKAEHDWKAAQNASVRGRLAESLQAGGMSIDRSQGKWGRNRTMALTIPILNTADKDIAGWSGTVTLVRRATNETMLEVPLQANHSEFEPFTRQPMTWTVTVSPGNDIHEGLWDVQLEDAMIFLMPQAVEFDDGTKLELPHPEIGANPEAAFAMLNFGCAQFLQSSSPDSGIVAAIGYPTDGSRKDDEYRVVSKVLTTEGSERKTLPMSCAATFQDGSWSLVELKLGSETIVERTET
jgi:hypothetical protein